MQEKFIKIFFLILMILISNSLNVDIDEKNSFTSTIFVSIRIGENEPKEESLFTVDTSRATSIFFNDDSKPLFHLINNQKETINLPFEFNGIFIKNFTFKLEPDQTNLNNNNLQGILGLGIKNGKNILIDTLKNLKHINKKVIFIGLSPSPKILFEIDVPRKSINNYTECEIVSSIAPYDESWACPLNGFVFPKSKDIKENELIEEIYEQVNLTYGLPKNDSNENKNQSGKRVTLEKTKENSFQEENEDEEEKSANETEIKEIKEKGKSDVILLNNSIAVFDIKSYYITLPITQMDKFINLFDNLCSPSVSEGYTYLGCKISEKDINSFREIIFIIGSMGFKIHPNILFEINEDGTKYNSLIRFSEKNNYVFGFPFLASYQIKMDYDNYLVGFNGEKPINLKNVFQQKDEVETFSEIINKNLKKYKFVIIGASCSIGIMVILIILLSYFCSKRRVTSELIEENNNIGNYS